MEFEYYKDGNGKEVADHELLSIKPEWLRDLIAKKLGFYGQKSFQQMLHSRDLEKIINKDGLWELKFRTPIPYRSLCLLDRLKLIILRSFKKDYDGSIKQKEITIAWSRANDWINRDK